MEVDVSPTWVWLYSHRFVCLMGLTPTWVAGWSGVVWSAWG